MQIKNPTKESIEIQIGTNHYLIEAEGTLNNVPEADARYWQESLHKFLILKKDVEREEQAPVVSTPKVEAVIEAPVEEKEETVEVKEEEVAEVVAEAKEEKPVAPVAKEIKKVK